MPRPCPVRRALVVVLAVAPMAASCGSRTVDQGGPQDHPDGSVADSGVDAPATRDADVDAGVLPRALDDGQVAGVLEALDAGEIRLANLALARSSTPEVGTYAEAMVQEHGFITRYLAGLLARESLRAVPSEASRTVESDVQSAFGMLLGLRGLDFDRAYLALQIQDHQRALGLIDTVLLPDVQDVALRDFLTVQVRPMFQAHLDEALRLQQLLSS